MDRTCTGVVGSNPTGGMAGLHTLVEPILIVDLINCIVVRVIKTYFNFLILNLLINYIHILCLSIYKVIYYHIFV